MASKGEAESEREKEKDFFLTKLLRNNHKAKQNERIVEN